MFKKEFYYLSFLLFVIVVLSCLGRLIEPFDILSHFRLHYIASSVFFIIISRLYKDKKMFRYGIGSFGINIVMIIWALSLVISTGETTKLKHHFYSGNVLSMNKNYKAVDNLSSSKFDHILLMETNHDWIRNLKALKQSHPYHTLHPRTDNFGISFFSKHPIKQEAREFQSKINPDMTFPYIWAEAKDFIFIGVHTIPPLRGWASVRNEQMQEIAGLIQSRPEKKFIVMGDFNDTLWSTNFQKFIKVSQLKPASLSLLPTWPAPLIFLGIKIDHALVKGFSNVRFYIEDSIGSDHLPISLEIYDDLTSASAL